jgi:hypothetical protein
MQQPRVRVLCPSIEGDGEAFLPLPIPGIKALRQMVQEQFGQTLPGQVRRSRGSYALGT